MKAAKAQALHSTAVHTQHSKDKKKVKSLGIAGYGSQRFVRLCFSSIALSYVSSSALSFERRDPRLCA